MATALSKHKWVECALHHSAAYFQRPHEDHARTAERDSSVPVRSIAYAWNLACDPQPVFCECCMSVDSAKVVRKKAHSKVMDRNVQYDFDRVLLHLYLFFVLENLEFLVSRMNVCIRIDMYSVEYTSWKWTFASLQSFDEIVDFQRDGNLPWMILIK